MLTAVQGVYRNGRAELSGTPSGVPDEAQVIVTFTEPHAPLSSDADPRAHGTSRERAAELRARLMPFAEDWERAEMDVYDSYDATKPAL